MSIAVIFHCFYFDLIDEFLGYFSKIGMPFSLFVTMPSDVYTKEEVDKAYKKILDAYPNAVILSCKNFGADIVPCFVVMDYILLHNLHFDKYVKVHTKKSLAAHGDNPYYGESWRKSLCNVIFDNFKENLSKGGIIASSLYSKNFNNYKSDRPFKRHLTLLSYYGYNFQSYPSEKFSIGTMFMIDGDIWEDFFRRNEKHPFLMSLIKKGGYSVPFERFFELLPTLYNRKIHLQ